MFIDLRSDTVTKPTPAMLDAMFEASVGDDVFGEDETVRELETRVAGMLGMEAGLFCPSGTMANQVAIKALTQTPGELICDQLSHIYQYEGGGIAFHSGLSVKLLQGERGLITPEMIANNINPDDVHKPETQLVCLENTCNRGGGSIYGLEKIENIYKVCHLYQLKLHLDGARIFNAIIAGRQDAGMYGKYFDTVSVCLSKGLGAPVGSVLAGSKKTIAAAKRIRKLMGGGMRQAGYLAAAGLYAVDHHIDRLKEDHRLARQIGTLLEGKSYVESIMPIETNIVVFRLHPQLSTEKFLATLATNNIRAVAFGPQAIRFVTHLDVSEKILDPLEKVLNKIG